MIVTGVPAGATASFVQRPIRTTLGKALFFLRLRQEDGNFPAVWR
ncbi:hypothetical protein [Nocardia rhamnosiphila]